MTTERDIAAPARFQRIVLASPPNWTAMFFFAVLAFLHWCVCIPAFRMGRIEGYMSLIFATVFTAVSVAIFFIRSVITIEPASRVISVKSGFRRFAVARNIPFEDIHAVRLTMSAPPDYPISRIEVLCDNEDIECPPTTIPREEALCLAILMGVQLIKVHASNTPQMPRV